jgi:hypothetical protein
MLCAKRGVAALAVLALATLSLAGCSGSQQVAQTGTVKLQITDGPFPFDLIDSATVTLTSIEVRKASASQPAASSQPAEGDEHREDTESRLDDDQGDGQQGPSSQPSYEMPEVDQQAVADSQYGHGQDGAADKHNDVTPSSQPSDDSQWIVIFSGEKEFNLLDLRNGKTDLLANTDIPIGTYTGMRLIVTQGTVTLKDGRTFKLKIPSGAQSGIKLHFTFTVEAGQEKPLLLDVNLSRAFKAIPEGAFKHAKEIKGFMFRPSLGMRMINVLQAGSISGKVTDTAQTPLANVTVTALRDGQEVVQTSSDADGTYKLVGLATGTYVATFSAAGYVDLQTGDVAVTAGQAVENVDVSLETAAPATQP